MQNKAGFFTIWNVLGWLCILTFLVGCDAKSRIEKEISKKVITFRLERFDQEFAAVNTTNFTRLKDSFSFLFSTTVADSVWLNKASDSIQLEINEEVSKAYPQSGKISDSLYDFFQHLNYYFPQVGIPERVITITSDVNYKQNVILTDKLLLISLDTYLGADHHFYLGIQEYIRKNFKPDQMLPDIAKAYAKRIITHTDDRTFLSHLIYYGKILYLQDRLLPELADHVKIGYSEEEYDWTTNNEEQIWRYFIEKELLYSTDQQLLSRFLHPAPFSKFYLELDGESPGRVGQYIGWQIVKAYMDKNEVSLQELVKIAPEELFKKSNYKPKKV